MVFGLYGGSAPLGFFFGIFISGLTGQFLSVGWYFWIGAFLVFSTAVPAVFAIPNDMAAKKKQRVEMDWIGSALTVSGMILVVFALTDVSHARRQWREPYIYSTLIGGSLLLGLALYYEGWRATTPLVPLDVFRTPSIKPLFIALLLSYGNLGVFLLYATLYMQDVMGASPLQVSAWYTPMAAGGVIISVAAGYHLHLISGTTLLIFSGLGWAGASLLFALAPDGANYWAFVFPAMLGGTIGIDITFNTANVFIVNNLPSAQQGLAGALINSLYYFGIAFTLGFADFTQTRTSNQGLKKSYQNVFWYQLGLSLVSIGMTALFVRIEKAQSDLTFDERAATNSQAMQSKQTLDASCTRHVLEAA